MSHPDNEPSYFERERERLTLEISASFDQLLSSTNHLNRQLEEVLGMSKEYGTLASLWSSFHQLMKSTNEQEEESAEVAKEEEVLDASTTSSAAGADETVRLASKSER